jgi:DNA-binding SARP family transcriptional activator
MAEARRLSGGSRLRSAAAAMVLGALGWLALRAVGAGLLFAAAALAGSMSIAVVGDTVVVEAIAGAVVAAGVRRRRLEDDGWAEVRLLGPLSARLAGGRRVAPSAWRSSKNVDLLRMLALAGRPILADEAMALLWPGADERKARASLRTAVFEVRRVLGQHHVVRDGEHLSLADVWVDVNVFRALAASARAAFEAGEFEACVRAARRAEALHVAPVAARATDSIPQSELLAELDDLRRDMLVDAGHSALALGRPSVAVELLREVVRDSLPLERAFRCLMVAYESTGEVGLALQTYERCRETLAEELGVDPSPQTQQVFQRLLAAQPAAVDEPAPLGGEAAGPADGLHRLLSCLDDDDLDALLLVAVADGDVHTDEIAEAYGAPVDAAVGALLDLGCVSRSRAGAVRVRDPRLRDCLRDWMRPQHREQLEARLAAASAERVDPTAPGRDLVARARAALAERRLAEAQHLARLAASSPDHDVRADAVALSLLPEVLGGAGGDWVAGAALEAAREHTSCGGSPTSPHRRRLECLAALAEPTSVDLDPDVLAIDLDPRDRWMVARLLLRSGHLEDAALLADVFEGYDDALAGPLMLLIRAHAVLAQREPEESLRLLEHLVDGLTVPSLVLPEALGTAAAIAAVHFGDARRAELLLAAYEHALEDGAEGANERFWRLLARSTVVAGPELARVSFRTRAEELATASLPGYRRIAACLLEPHRPVAVVA